MSTIRRYDIFSVNNAFLSTGALSVGPNSAYLGLKNAPDRVILGKDNPIIYEENGVLPPFEETTVDASNITGIVSVEKGGTGANNAADARKNLGITPSGIGAAAATHSHPIDQVTGISDALAGKAASSHNHNVSQITGVLPVSKGGTGQTTIDGLKKILGVGGGGPVGQSYNLKNVSVGKRVWFNYSYWRCVHISGNTYYLCLDKLEGYAWFGSNNVYASSTILQECRKYETDMAEDSLAICISTTVNGATSKVFIPSKEQCEGGFSWFKTEDNRITYRYGNTKSWWTSSPDSSSDVWYVNTAGSLDRYSPTNTYGFRPFIALPLY